MEIKPIKTEGDYKLALSRIEELWGSAEGTAQADDLEVLVTLTEAYEREHYPIAAPDPIEAIKFRLEQEGKDYRALVGVIGQRTRVYEVMRGDRPLSLNMIRQLHRRLRIPAEVLIRTSAKTRRTRRSGGIARKRARRKQSARR